MRPGSLVERKENLACNTHLRAWMVQEFNAPHVRRVPSDTLGRPLRLIRAKLRASPSLAIQNSFDLHRLPPPSCARRFDATPGQLGGNGVKGCTSGLKLPDHGS